MGLPEFVAGWALGAKTGDRGFDDVVAGAKNLLASKEFNDLVDAGRSHLSFVLEELSRLVAKEDALPPSQDLLDMVRALRARRDAG